MYKVGDKVLCQTSPNLWKEGVIAEDALMVEHWWVDVPGERLHAHERDLKPRTSPTNSPRSSISTRPPRSLNSTGSAS